MKERLQKLLAKASYGSRRKTEILIQNGRVTVNGRVAKLGDKADINEDRVAVDGQPIRLERPIYLMLNKPPNVLTSLEDELGEGRRTVRDLIDLSGHIYPVGRLDKQSDGLILMTNDGELAHKLTHPRYGHEKMYHALLDGDIPPSFLQQWRKGVLLEGKMTAPVNITLLKQKPDHTWLRIIMREGRKRQIRRIAAQFGYPVQKLTRKQIGPLQLGNLRPGEWRHLTKEEIGLLRRTTQIRKPPVQRKRSLSAKRSRKR